MVGVNSKVAKLTVMGLGEILKKKRKKAMQYATITDIIVRVYIM